MDNRVSILKKYIDEARIVMFFGGAGGWVGDRVVVINKEPLNIRKLKVDLFIQASVGETFAKMNL